MTLASITGATAGAERRLPGFALFGGLLAMAGLPIYIHAPKFYVDEYGVGLGLLGTVLFALRLIDFVQDPVLGWLAGATGRARRLAVALAATLMALAMFGLFAVPAPVAPVLWFAITLTVLFSAFSFLNIVFYAQGVRKAIAMAGAGHVRLAAWRETGALLGVCAAAAAPTVLSLVTDAPFAGFAIGFVVLAALSVVVMDGEWSAVHVPSPVAGFAAVLRDGAARRLLIVALVNATPVAVTSTLFLFFVESRLAAPGWEGPLLILFFLSAAVSAPGWARAAQHFGTRRTLLAGMALAVLSFGFAGFLGAGDVAVFAVICVASGAAIGADLTLLAALFARRMSVVSPEAGAAFGLWSFVTKFTLAVAAIALLPLLEASGFTAGGENPPAALLTLSVLYAAVPCALKVVAMTLLYFTPLNED